MLITFQTPAYANIVMFGEVALPLIRMMGHSGCVPGAILAADIPAALDRLRAAVAAHAGEPLDPALPGGVRARDEERVAVSLAHRALPLIELLSAAAREGEHVMWDH